MINLNVLARPQSLTARPDRRTRPASFRESTTTRPRTRRSPTLLRRRCRILLAARDTARREGLEQALRSTGNDVMCVSDGERALHAYDGQTFDLVLLALDLPTMNGPRLARELRSREALLERPRVPIIALAPPGVPTRRTHHIDAFLPTSPRPEQLHAMLEHRVDRRPRILVMHAQTAYRDKLESTIRRCNGTVATARSRAEALTLLRIDRIDAAILEDEGQDFRGPQLVRELRNAGFSGPVFGVCQRLMGPAADSWRAAGVHDVFPRTPAPMLLVHAISRSLSRPGHREVDPDIADLVPHYLADRRADLHAMNAALRHEQYDVVRRKAHQIRGTGTSYGFPELTALATQLENAIATQRLDPVPTLIATMTAIIG